MNWKSNMILLMMAVLLCLPLEAGDSGPAKKFEARVEVSGEQGTRSMKMTLKIRRFTPVEEALALARTTAGGQATLAALIRHRSDGELQLGGLRMPVGIVIARKLDDGKYRYTIVTARRIRAEEENLEQKSLDYPFSVSTFVAGEWESEDGLYYPAAKIHVDPEDGSVSVEQYKIEPGVIDQITLVD